MRKFSPLACVFVFLFFLPSCFVSPPAEESSFLAMDTLVSLSAEGRDAKETLSRIEDRIKLIDGAILSAHRPDSEISRLNSSGSAPLSPELYGWLETSLEIQKKSSGAFDISLGKIKLLWEDAGKNQSLPLPKAFESLISGGLQLSDGKISGLDNRLLDLGAVGKGIACDEAGKILQNSRCARAVVSVGGSILLYGGGNFKVGIRHPEKGAQEIIGVLETYGAFVSTSGSYERGVEIGGAWYPHIFDPKTGYPPENGLVSVTVRAGSGLVSDALSTACFVLGAEGSAPLLKFYGAQAIFINDKKEIYTSEELAPYFALEDNAYSVFILK
ncbi:MAG: FAD:protein FMN transferase [Oscillospiraceae bacterium]|jgi:thiamine biosynthesis lipoprotein|nr:FAD:protein FMN transferase [Oscillospiraceae bacterium]